MLNSAEHEIFSANKYELNSAKHKIFSANKSTEHKIFSANKYELNSAEHEIFSANKYELNSAEHEISLLINQLSMNFSLPLNIKMPTKVGIFIFISREIFMLSYV